MTNRSRKNKTKAPLYKNAKQPPKKRVRDLLSRMTLDEKAAQMMCVWQQKSETLLDGEGNFDYAKAKKAFKKGNGIGQVGRPSDAGSTQAEPSKGKDPRGQAELTNAIQKFFIENSRLGIPVIFHEECLHGRPPSVERAFRSRSRWRQHLIPSWSKLSMQ